RVLDEFVVHPLGENALRHYRIILDVAAAVARPMKKSMPLVTEYRRDTGCSYRFPWSIRITTDLHLPFAPSHEHMANLKLSAD
ncbi:pyrimidine/purine nucleotide monophosphate nucleosidase domain-containing protein, partial [Escherichia coli]|uniref:pyrimidine/purine nucleotide monophosphate nucleosidase domain-containing protein n=1 Tax=Escherichia coli TaxID=562 RepID=UPI0024AF99E9